MARHDSGILELPEGSVVFDVTGAGPAIVLTHGTPSWSTIWRDVVPHLSATHTVYTWDLLGYGRSVHRAGVLPSIRLHAQTLARLVEHWQLDRPFLVGHDIGGATTLRAHLIEQVPARGLALIDAVAFQPWIGPHTAHMRSHLAAYRSMPNDFFRSLVALHLEGVTARPLPGEVQRRYLDMYDTPEGQQRWLDRTAGYDEADTEEFLPHLRRIDVPTTVLWGEEDQWLPLPLGERLAAAIPGARFDTIPGCGHFAMEDDPDRVAEALGAAASRSDPA